ncbi:MAG TPA: hypothetical protein VFG83_05510 [Kofleriaceae bacterium]|nr:hypothetical protein [Kofleriaceae bacterium]
MAMLARVSVGLVALMIPSVATANPRQQLVDDHRGMGFLEINGGYGLQIGTTPYVPQADGSFEHPLTHGYAIGASGGAYVAEGVSFLISYEFTSAHSRKGEIANAVDDIDGEIHYHSVAAGLRITRDAGAGWFFGQLQAGIVLPFQTQLTFRYNPALTALPEPITGSGSRTSSYGIAYGAQAALGYAIPISDGVYLGAMIKLKAFETSNNGENTKLDNFVVDFTAEPPVATTATIENGTVANPPNTYSVQDIRAHLVIGYQF